MTAPADVLKMIKEKEVKFVDLRFTDTRGKEQHVSVPSKQFTAQWKLGTFHIYFYALNKDGVHGSASLWRNGYDPNRRAKYAVHDGTQGRLEDCAAYFDEVSASRG